IEMSYEIRSLEQIEKNRKIVQCDIKRLTAPGENYGSLMLAVDLITEDNDDGKEYALHIVAKAVPKNEFVQKTFRSPLTFKKELELYRTIVPTLKEFHAEEGLAEEINFFPEFYGGRLGIGPNFDTFDNDAVILLENLKKRGFTCADRTIGFDLEPAKFILKDLAMLHAVPLALKLKKPEVFSSRLLPYLNNTGAFSDIEDKIFNHMIESIIQVAEESSDCLPFTNRIRDELIKGAELTGYQIQSREPFATLIHCDLWINNTMIKLEDSKINTDLLCEIYYFFIFDSIKTDVVIKNCDHLVEFYHRNFVSNLEKFNINVEPFSLDEFKKRNRHINQGVVYIFFQCLVMLQPIFADENAVKELETVSQDDFLEKVEIPQAHKDKLWMIVKEFKNTYE
ncbi:hypothetical protein NQ318_010205, partial [Aromia moschata]